MSDFINGVIEFIGALLLVHNCWLLFQHKRVQGVSVLTTAFFTAWGAWNLYFYPAHNLWVSFAGGLCLAAANLTWVLMAIYYSRKASRTPPPLPKRNPPVNIAVPKPTSTLDRIYAARGINRETHPAIEENRRREAMVRKACYSTYSVETRPWVTHILDIEGCKRLVAERKGKQAAHLKAPGTVADD